MSRSETRKRKEENKMYVVVRFPKSLKGAKSYDFNIYAKTHSQKAKMMGYYEEQRARYTDCYVLLTTKENAEKMKRVWHNYVGNNIGSHLSRTEKVRSMLGHNPENDSRFTS
jgi:predicted cupin superfamily sugar epimerase